MDGEVIDKEIEPKKFNWWHLGIDCIFSLISSLLITFGTLQLQGLILYYSDSPEFKLPRFGGFPFGFLDSFFGESLYDRMNFLPFLVNLLIYFAIIFFFLRYKNIKFSKRN